ncbi:TetR/AcrR family transcriptional regulator [Bradyrhizobium genosp. L]|uniref:TetR/AcrR family transcriptional regulator n=1 Tax=Bradyrhizobium genosp. L TaxID=83637 RepID=UPI0018A2613C|nr:TetR/AcrR family transcriptional regulator [Bradyrhizobium genosp. L]QPF88021.1 TetR/AcrR family transcriptional regulator [Bradyrhizobium genosp. L]
MDNPSRSERSRNAALQAAITIISRDGPGRLTLDAIARESGLSKGGLMHQFRTKEAVLKALLQQQMAHFDEFAARYKEKARAMSAQPELATQLATVREATTKPNSAALALLAAMVEDPSLMNAPRDIDIEQIKAIKAEASDPELAMLRWAAARGLLLSSLFGLSPLTEAERDRLFERLLDDQQWAALERPKPDAKPAKPAPAAKSASPARPSRKRHPST